MSSGRRPPFAALLGTIMLLASSACSDRYVVGTLPSARPDVGSDAAYDPCLGLSCGSVCTTCPPNDLACVEGRAFQQCSQDGVCLSDVPVCGVTAYVPCAGKRCGEACHQCDPRDALCVEVGAQQYCSGSGTCTVDSPICVK